MRAGLAGLTTGAALLLAAACAPAAPPPAPIVQAMFAAETEVALDDMARHPRGFYWRDLAPGDGRQAAVGLTVDIAYVVQLPDGRVVDRAEPDAPMRFKLGERQSIRALELSLPGMAVGGLRQFVIPPELAYGARGRGRVPPHATLVMLVRLVRVS